MAASGAHADGPHVAAPLDVQDWRCGVCLEMLYKPCVAPACGHIYCFWCMHRSMDSRDVSRCPVCRAQHDRLPRVCTLLTSYLLRQYPAESAARAAEVKGEEADWGVQAAEVDDLMPGAISLDPSCDAAASAVVGAYTPTPADFQCSHPNCSQLLVQPRVPVCGHPVHSLDCLARDTTAGAPCCPLCHLPVGQDPAVCRQLGTLVSALFLHASQQVQRPLLTPAAAEAVTAVGEATGPGTADREPDAEDPEQQGATSPPIGTSNAGGHFSGRPVDIQRALRDYVHFGIGCDCCGAYPIRGKRFKCLDCPEAVGFDLCEACHRGSLVSYGRFNQRHEAGHRMQEQKPVYDVLHLLKVLHPEKSFTELHQLLRFAAVRPRSVPQAAAAEDTQPPAASEDQSQPAVAADDQSQSAVAAHDNQQADIHAEAGPSQPAAAESDADDPHDGHAGGPVAIVLDPASAADLIALARQISQQQAQEAADADDTHADSA